MVGRRVGRGRKRTSSLGHHVGVLWSCRRRGARTLTRHWGEFELNIKCRGENERIRMATGDEGR